MSETTSEWERQLRKLMNIAAGEPPGRVTVEAVRRGVVRRRLTASVAAAAAFVLVGGLGVALAAQRSGPGPSGENGPLPVGVPRFYVVQARSVSGTGLTTTVRSTGTGRILAHVHCPVAGQGVWLVAPADNRIFFLLCENAVANSQAAVGPSRIYRFQLTRTGRIRGYAPVRGGTLTGPPVRDMTVTPDGAEIAVTVFTGQTQGPASLPEIIVINTKTGSHALWRSARPVPGTIFYPVYEMSLTADGKELAFLSQPRCIRGKNAPKCRVRGGEEVRALGHAASGGALATARVLLRQSQIMRLSTGYINAAVISPDGVTITMAIVGNVSGPVLPDSVSIRQVAASGIRHLRIVYRMVTGNGFSYSAFGADPSVRHFLFDAGPSSGSINGWVNRGRLVRLRPAGNNVIFEVW